MSKKTPPAPTKAPAAPAFDADAADFPALLERFNNSTCDTESYALATYMGQRKFAEERNKLLPAGIEKQLDFDGNGGTTNQEWAVALVAAKKLKLEAGLELPVDKVDQLIDRARDIYIKTRPKDEAKDKASNDCRRL